ncbi:TPA: hypothetical protein ACN6ZO_001426 [Escherichia albertii]|uniref:YcxB family protein n=1 Tax=Escherichia albertii TaxID=208962 RepID=A0ABD7E9I6_ESCAL|nr:hypothetical protein [Escherichia albertii]EFE6906909.1 hypothetical protein [Escherichia albertii]EFF0773442.1 hypothetical protein [Escherichia albertii]MCQ8983373.1 hypothetical protein [Escherichia albertii]MCQ9014243.1 hypothetical protein [Escherichia albertii]MCV3249780.1 hypothetical protein [Escherichia albertii]
MKMESHSPSPSENCNESNHQFTRQYVPFSLNQTDFLTITGLVLRRYHPDKVPRLHKAALYDIIAVTFFLLFPASLVILGIFNIEIELSVWNNITDDLLFILNKNKVLIIVFWLHGMFFSVKTYWTRYKQKKAQSDIYNQNAITEGLNFQIDGTGVKCWKKSGTHSFCVWSEINDLIPYKDIFVLVINKSSFIWLSDKEEEALAFIHEKIAQSRQPA